MPDLPSFISIQAREPDPIATMVRELERIVEIEVRRAERDRLIALRRAA